MLKFILALRSAIYELEIFQNILCWSLSQKQQLVTRRLVNFKTSYVEVYPMPFLKIMPLFVFQNILCWSLSHSSSPKFLASSISKHLMLKFIILIKTTIADRLIFQNILCWSLSVMHSFSSECKANFKTSYVEVYPIPHVFQHTRFIISKHLMLKFIASGKCYSL